MKNKVVNAIERHQMLLPGDRVLVALSGGADSMALLHVLLSLKEEYRLHLAAAHYHHGIRGAEADRDEAFVRGVCAKWDVPLTVGHGDVPQQAKESGLGLEECAREMRYAFLEQAAQGALIATAHTLSDCEETFLFNLSRGASLHGLTAIPPVRGRIIRPLIGCSRDEIENYCRENGIDFVTDSTNDSDDYTRNRLRHRVVPELKACNPSFDGAFSRLIDGLREDDELLGELAQSVLERAQTESGYRADALLSVHPSLQKRAVAAAVEALSGVKPEQLHILNVCELLRTGGDVQVSGGVSLRVRGGLLYRKPEQAEDWSQPAFDGENVLPVGTVLVEFYQEINQINIEKFNKQLLDNCVDYDTINGKLVFSSIREGDTIRLLGRGVTKPLRRLFAEKGIEAENRKRIVLLRDDDGVVWADGFGVSERCAVNGETKRLIILSKYD